MRIARPDGHEGLPGQQPDGLQDLQEDRRVGVRRSGRSMSNGGTGWRGRAPSSSGRPCPNLPAGPTAPRSRRCRARRRRERSGGDDDDGHAAPAERDRALAGCAQFRLLRANSDPRVMLAPGRVRQRLLLGGPVVDAGDPNHHGFRRRDARAAAQSGASGSESMSAQKTYSHRTPRLGRDSRRERLIFRWRSSQAAVQTAGTLRTAQTRVVLHRSDERRLGEPRVRQRIARKDGEAGPVRGARLECRWRGPRGVQRAPPLARPLPPRPSHPRRRIDLAAPAVL